MTKSTTILISVIALLLTGSVFAVVALMTFRVGEPESLSGPLTPPAELLLSEKADELALPQTVASRVKAVHAQGSDSSLDSIRVEDHSREVWSDGCLGRGGPAESCLAALTEGWRVEVADASGNGTVYRTDLSGEQIRRES